MRLPRRFGPAIHHASRVGQDSSKRQKEGKVVASIPPTPELRKLMEITFTRRYGIATEFVPARGGTIIQRMVNEAKAGVQYFDLHIGGTESVITGLLPENILDAHRSLFYFT